VSKILRLVQQPPLLVHPDISEINLRFHVRLTGCGKKRHASQLVSLPLNLSLIFNSIKPAYTGVEWRRHGVNGSSKLLMSTITMFYELALANIFSLTMPGQSFYFDIFQANFCIRLFLDYRNNKIHV
jgi:hypothetical protein